MQMCYFSYVYKSVGNFENIIKSRGTLSKDELTVKRGGGSFEV